MRKLRLPILLPLPVIPPDAAPRRSRRSRLLAAGTLTALGAMALGCAALTLAAAAGAPTPQLVAARASAPVAAPPASELLASQAEREALARRDVRLKFDYEDRLFAMRAEIEARARQNMRLQAALAALEQQAARLDARVAALAAIAARLDSGVKTNTPTGPARPEANAPQKTSENIGLRGGDGEGSASSRLVANSRTLARIDAAALAAAGRILAPVAAENSRVAAALDEIGLAPERLAPAKARTAVGGPYEAWNSPALPGATAFESAFGALNAALARRAFLRAALPHAPLRAPLLGPHEVSSGYGYRIDPFFGRAALHSGMDFVGEFGERVRAAASGAVTIAGDSGGYGAMVEIDHGGGLATRYGHLSEIYVVEGQKIPAGAVIGALGSSGRSTGPHLHYEIREQGSAVDPAPFLKAGRLIDPTS